MDLKITKTLVIPSNEIKWRFSRSSGPGGQNVNKIESRVEIIFNLEDSKALNDYQKAILKINLQNKLVKNCLFKPSFIIELSFIKASCLFCN